MFGYKTIKRILDALGAVFGFQVPSSGTIRGWILRFGYKQLEKPLEKAEDWAILGDATVTIGQHKTLVIVGTRVSPLIERGDLTLKHTDIEVLALDTTKTLNGDIVCKNGENALKRIGGSADSMTTDQGSDMKRGGRLLQSAHDKMKCVYDIPHKIALVVQDALENDSLWKQYLSHTSETIPLIQQTELGAIKPPSIRTKARYMSADVYVQWYTKTSRMVAEGRLKEIGISNERFKKYFWWFDKFKWSMEKWNQMFHVVDIINREIRAKGLSEETYQGFLEKFDIAQIEDNQFVRNALDAVYEEVEKLEPDQVVLGSTEIVESFIGKYKVVGATTGQGVNSHALAMVNLTGKSPNVDEVKQAMEACPIKKALGWVKQMIGDGLANIRRTFYRKIKDPLETGAIGLNSTTLSCFVDLPSRKTGTD